MCVGDVCVSYTCRPIDTDDLVLTTTGTHKTISCCGNEGRDFASKTFDSSPGLATLCATERGGEWEVGG